MLLQQSKPRDAVAMALGCSWWQHGERAREKVRENETADVMKKQTSEDNYS